MYIPKFNLTCGDRCDTLSLFPFHFICKVRFMHANVAQCSLMLLWWGSYSQIVQKTLTFGNHTTAPKRPHHCVQISVNQSVTSLTFVTHWYQHRVCQSSWGWWVQLRLSSSCGEMYLTEMHWLYVASGGHHSTTPPHWHKPLVILKLPSSPQPSDHTHRHVKRKKTYSTYIRGQKEMHMVILQ